MSQVEINKKLQKARDLVKAGHFGEGLQLYDVLVRQFPIGYGEYGCAAAHSGDFELADRIWTKFYTAQRKDAKALFWLAGQYGKIGIYGKCRALYREVVGLEPGNLEWQTQLATILVRGKSDDEGRQVVAKCLELDPRSETARYLSAHLDRLDNKLPEAEQQLRDLLKSDLKLPQIRNACHSELVYILDRTERYDEAMAQREERKRHAQAMLNIKEEQGMLPGQFDSGTRHIQSMPKNILETWGKTFPADERAVVAPVAFLSGAARSGTTLFERILDAHPAIAACDEAAVFGKLVPRIDIFAPTVPAQRLNALRQLYVKSFATVLETSVAGKTLVDKNPAKTLWLPFFLRVFPDLRVLIALRDPRDVMISYCFQDNPSSYHLSLEQLTTHFAAVMDVWLAVREWEGLNWLETRYEDTVADMEKEGRRITSFLGLEWNEHQAQFHDRNREKMTLSNNYYDVTKPVYKRAMGRWRNYEKHLAPIMGMLEPYCRKFGYA